MSNPQVGTWTRILSPEETLNVDTGAAYADGDFIGEHSEKYLSYILGNGTNRTYSGTVLSTLWTNKTGSAAEFQVTAHFFSAAPTVASYTDNSAISFPNADQDNYLGSIAVSSFEQSGPGHNLTSRLPFAIPPGANTLYVMMEANGALDNTGGAVGNFNLRLGVYLDQPSLSA